MTVIIVGGGVAGSTLARSLARHGRPFLLVDGRKGPKPDRGLGLWGRSQVALAHLGLRGFIDCPERVGRIPPAAYRSRDGTWVSRCSEFSENRQRVCATLESQVLAALRADLPADSVVEGSVASVAAAAEGPASVTLECGRRIEGSVVVGADGATSAVRTATFPGAAAVPTGAWAHGGVIPPEMMWRFPNPFGSGGDGGPPQFLNLNHNPGPLRDGCGWETLALGRRFAMVPLPNGGAFWFATHSLQTDKETGTSDEALAELVAAYEDFHKPVPDVVDLGVTLQKSGEAALRHEEIIAAPKMASWCAGRAVLIGDAAHAMPCNLAQGASLSIEGAFLLGEAFRNVKAATLADPKMPADTIAKACAEYEAVHRPRLAQCRAVTRFTSMLASPASRPTEGLRNLMRYVPQPLNGKVFDTALDFSLGDWPGYTRNKWKQDDTMFLSSRRI